MTTAGPQRTLIMDIPELERSSGSLQSMADSIDNSTFVRSRKEPSVRHSDDEDDDDDDDDTYDGMEMDFDDASTIATTFTCLQHQYQQQKQVKLEGIFEKLGVKADADDDEKTKAWEKLSKDELLQLLAALRVDLGGGANQAAGAEEPKKSALKTSTSKPKEFHVPVPPWSGGIVEEEPEDLDDATESNDINVQVKFDDRGQEEYSVKVPPWAAKKSEDSVPRTARTSVTGNSVTSGSHSHAEDSRRSRSSYVSESKRSVGSKGSNASSHVLDQAGPLTRQWFREQSCRDVTSTASPVSVNEDLPEEIPAEDDDIFSVKLPPWLEKKDGPLVSKGEIRFTPSTPSPAAISSSRRRSTTPVSPPTPAIKQKQVPQKPKPVKQPRPQHSRAVHTRTSVPPPLSGPMPADPMSNKKAVNFLTPAPPARPSLKATKKPPSFRNLFGGKKSSSRKVKVAAKNTTNSNSPPVAAVATTAGVVVPAVPSNIQQKLHSTTKRKEGNFLQAADEGDGKQNRLAMINANWNSHYTANKRKPAPRKETNARHVRETVPRDADSISLDRSNTSSTVRSNTSRSLQSGSRSMRSASSKSTQADC